MGASLLILLSCFEFQVSVIGLFAGCRLRVSGFGIRDSGFEVHGGQLLDLGFGLRVSSFGFLFRISGFGFRISGSGFGIRVSRYMGGSFLILLWASEKRSIDWIALIHAGITCTRSRGQFFLKDESN